MNGEACLLKRSDLGKHITCGLILATFNRRMKK
jgi:hypothetical protein